MRNLSWDRHHHPARFAGADEKVVLAAELAQLDTATLRRLLRLAQHSGSLLNHSDEPS